MHSTTKPYNGGLALSVLEKYKAHLDEMPMEQYGMKRGSVLITLPSILAEIANAGIEAIRRLEQLTVGVFYGGARLSEEIGDLLTENGVNLMTVYGM